MSSRRITPSLERDEMSMNQHDPSPPGRTQLRSPVGGRAQHGLEGRHTGRPSFEARKSSRLRMTDNLAQPSLISPTDPKPAGSGVGLHGQIIVVKAVIPLQEDAFPDVESGFLVCQIRPSFSHRKPEIPMLLIGLGTPPALRLLGATVP